jgi:hypothetical protein
MAFLERRFDKSFRVMPIVENSQYLNFVYAFLDVDNAILAYQNAPIPLP